MPRPPGAASSLFSPAGRSVQPARVRPTGPTRKTSPTLRRAPRPPPRSFLSTPALPLRRSACPPPEKQPSILSFFDPGSFAAPPWLNHKELSSVVRRKPRRAFPVRLAPVQVRVGLSSTYRANSHRSSDPSPPWPPDPPTATDPYRLPPAFPPIQQPRTLKQPRSARLYTPNPHALRAWGLGVAAFRPPRLRDFPPLPPPTASAGQKSAFFAPFWPFFALVGPFGASSGAAAASWSAFGPPVAAAPRAPRPRRPRGRLWPAPALRRLASAPAPSASPESFSIVWNLFSKFLRSMENSAKVSTFSGKPPPRGRRRRRPPLARPTSGPPRAPSVVGGFPLPSPPWNPLTPPPSGVRIPPRGEGEGEPPDSLPSVFSPLALRATGARTGGLRPADLAAPLPPAPGRSSPQGCLRLNPLSRVSAPGPLAAPVARPPPVVGGRRAAAAAAAGRRAAPPRTPRER